MFPTKANSAVAVKEPDAGDREQVADDGELLCHRLQLTLNLLDAGFDIPDVLAHLSEARPQGVGKVPELLDPPSPVVSRPARFHDDVGDGVLGEEAQEL